MIKNNIKNSKFRNHLGVGSHSRVNKTVYVVDYSSMHCRQTKKLGIRFEQIRPNNIGALEVNNVNQLDISCIRFTQKSFTKEINGSSQSLSQCEGVIFPTESNCQSWIIFTELKYCKETNNEKNINKARLQLYKTRYYYKKASIFDVTNTCYLIITLPDQNPPYSHMAFTQSYLLNLKRKHNVILRATDKVVINSDEDLLA